MKANQKAINIVGSIVVGISILSIGGLVKMILDVKATVNKADINAKAISKNSRVLHTRISDNHKKLEEVSEMAIRADCLSQVNREDIKCLK